MPLTNFLCKNGSIFQGYGARLVSPFLITFENIQTGATGKLLKKFIGRMTKNSLTCCGQYVSLKSSYVTVWNANVAYGLQ